MRSGCSLINNDLQKQRVINNLKRKDAVAHFSASLEMDVVVKNGNVFQRPKVFFQLNGHSSEANILLNAIHSYISKAINESNDQTTP